MQYSRTFTRGLAVLAIASAASLTALPSHATTGWQPVASERLMKLPAAYVDKAVQKDFLASPLAQAIDSNAQDIQTQLNAMASTQSQIDSSYSEQNVELKHQFLLEKSGYLDLVQEQQGLEREATQTRLATYERLYDRVLRERDREASSEVVIVREQQQAAKLRLEKNMERISELMQSESLAQQSRYSTEYEKNMASITRLQDAIRNHEANTAPALMGMELSREEYLRYLVQQEEANLALLDQEQELLAYMAKLIALDAQALENDINLAEVDTANSQKQHARLADSVDLFIP